MRAWITIFLLFAVVAAVLGFGDVVEGAERIGKVLFVGFLALAGVALLSGRTPRDRGAGRDGLAGPGAPA